MDERRGAVSVHADRPSPHGGLRVTTSDPTSRLGRCDALPAFKRIAASTSDRGQTSGSGGKVRLGLNGRVDVFKPTEHHECMLIGNVGIVGKDEMELAVIVEQEIAQLRQAFIIGIARLPVA